MCRPFKRYPKKLESFFWHSRCPDCGSKEFSYWEDGGHDVAIECSKCGSKFGVQFAPFYLIERIGVKK